MFIVVTTSIIYIYIFNFNFCYVYSDRHRVGIHIQFAWLLWRSTLLLKRSYKTWAIRFLLYLVSINFGMTYFGLYLLLPNL